MRSDRTQVFFEPFSHLNYVATIAKSVLLRPGAHRLTVVMKGTGNEQRYVLALGEQERFSVGEIPYVLGAIHRVQVRGY